MTTEKKKVTRKTTAKKTAVKKTAVKKPTAKRARTAKGRFVADDPRTPFINEAYEQTKTAKDYILALIILAGIVLLFMYKQ